MSAPLDQRETISLLHWISVTLTLIKIHHTPAIRYSGTNPEFLTLLFLLHSVKHKRGNSGCWGCCNTPGFVRGPGHRPRTQVPGTAGSTSATLLLALCPGSWLQDPCLGLCFCPQAVVPVSARLPLSLSSPVPEPWFSPGPSSGERWPGQG